MTEHKRDIWEIIASALNETLSAKEKEEFDLWMKDKGNRQFFEIIQGSKHAQATFSAEAKKRVFSRIETSLDPVPVRRINLWAYAAVASLAILMSFAFFRFILNPRPDTVSFVEMNIPYGVRSKVTLPDSTVVYLNSGSYLKYPARFTGESRIVSMKGEAYFEVREDFRHSFIVQADTFNVKVFGTHFNMKSYPEEDYFETSLLEGAVGVYTNRGKEDHAIRLVPNQKIFYTPSSGKLVVSEVDAELSAIWKDGKYYFEKESLQSIANKLERNFNIPVRIKSQNLNSEFFSGLFDKNKSVFQILDIMKLYKSFDYRLRNDTIEIYEKRK